MLITLASFSFSILFICFLTLLSFRFGRFILIPEDNLILNSGFSYTIFVETIETELH